MLLETLHAKSHAIAATGREFGARRIRVFGSVPRGEESHDSEQHQFTLEFWEDEGWFVGKLKEVPGVLSQGETLEELEENIADAYKLVCEETGEPL